MQINQYDKTLMSYIEKGQLRQFLCSEIGDKEGRLRYYKSLGKLKSLDIVIEFSGELSINSSSHFYKFQSL